MNVGEYIKKLRTQNGYSQEQLGRLVGVQRAAVQKWECGKVQNLKRETIKKLAELFSVSPASFFSDDISELSEPNAELKNTVIEMLKGYTKEELEQAIRVLEAMHKGD